MSLPAVSVSLTTDNAGECNYRSDLVHGHVPGVVKTFVQFVDADRRPIQLRPQEEGKAPRDSMHTVLITAKAPNLSMVENGLEVFSAIDATYPTLDPSGPLQARLATLSSAKKEMTLYIFDDFPAYLNELRKLYVDCPTATTALVRMHVAGGIYEKTMLCAAAATP